MEKLEANDDPHDVREVSSLGSWHLSSYKNGQGLEQLLDSSLQTYWQSDGPQPHAITVQFPQKITLEVCIFFTKKRCRVTKTSLEIINLFGLLRR
jgi:anaphase-promoting complex subunit 10